jgi:alpha-L-fucosidase
VQFDVVDLLEAIEHGQKLARYLLVACDGNAWRTISRGTTIGHRKLDRVPPTRADHVRLVVEETVGKPVLERMGLY